MSGHSYTQHLLLVTLPALLLSSTKASYCVSWDHHNHTHGIMVDYLDSAKLKYASISSNDSTKLMQLVEIKTYKTHGTTSEANWKILDDWCINHLVSLHEYCISWLVWDQAKGVVIRQNYSAANEKYERLKNGFYPTVLNVLETKNLEHHGNITDVATKSTLEAWCMSHKNMTVGSDNNMTSGYHYPEKKTFCVSWNGIRNVHGEVYDNIDAAKLKLSRITPEGGGGKLLQLIHIHTFQQKYIISNENLRTLDDWCVAHVSSMGDYCVSWHVVSSDRAAAEGVILTNYSAAIATYDSRDGTNERNDTVVIGVGTQVIEYHDGARPDTMERLKEWCRTRETRGRAAVAHPGIVVGVISTMVIFILL